MSVVTIYKQRNLLRIRKTTGRLADLLKQTLTYERKRQLMTKAERDAAGGRQMEFSTVRCYDKIVVDGEPQMRTNAGFLPRIQTVLEKAGLNYQVKDQIGRAHV